MPEKNIHPQAKALKIITNKLMLGKFYQGGDLLCDGIKIKNIVQNIPHQFLSIPSRT